MGKKKFPVSDITSTTKEKENKKKWETNGPKFGPKKTGRHVSSDPV